MSSHLHEHQTQLHITVTQSGPKKLIPAGQCYNSLLTARGLDYVIFKDPFQPNSLCDSMILPELEKLGPSLWK